MKYISKLITQVHRYLKLVTFKSFRKEFLCFVLWFAIYSNAHPSVIGRFISITEAVVILFIA
jgi:hypothetical protein